MSSASLTIDLGAITRNWQALDAMVKGETSAVVKANAYGLGASTIAKTLQKAGAKHFFVATADEGADLRQSLGTDAKICVFAGHMRGATGLIRDMNLIPMLNSAEQLTRHLNALPGAAFGIQLDTGMNRLGMPEEDWREVRVLFGEDTQHDMPALVISHLACADEPDHAMNARQLVRFREMTQDLNVLRSFANTGGVLLGKDYHFDITRPGIGVYGGAPFAKAEPVVSLEIPVIQCRTVDVGDSVGYGSSWVAKRPSRIATVSAGYADGIIRAGGPKGVLFAKDQPCVLAGRISMDLMGVDVTDLGHDPDSLSLLGPGRGVDDVAEAAGTIGYEILTSLGGRYQRRYVNG